MGLNDDKKGLFFPRMFFHTWKPNSVLQISLQCKLNADTMEPSKQA